MLLVGAPGLHVVMHVPSGLMTGFATYMERLVLLKRVLVRAGLLRLYRVEG